MLKTVWNIKECDDSIVDRLAFKLRVPRSVAAVFTQRGLDTAEKIDDFCKIGMENIHDPYLLPDINPAIERLNKAIDNQEHIYVHGDYDVDGVTSVAVVTWVLRLLGANFEFHVPHRMVDGYDLKEHIIDQAITSDAKLMISVDCGIRAINPVKYAKEQGLDMIITDHHHPREDRVIPDCIAVINPNRHDSEYPFNGLAGVGIAFKVMMALAHSRGLKVKPLMNDLLEYVALGTVADVAPMIDENRTLVYLGCQLLAKSDKPGIQKLLEAAGVKHVSTTAIGFFLGPRINAIGRLSDAATALELMLETNPTKAAVTANKLDTANDRRKSQQEQVTIEAEALIPENLDDISVLVLAAKGWHPGLVGLVAGKIAEKYGRPTLVCCINDEGHARGSARSTRDFNILDALNSHGVQEQFTKYGGHAFAAGFDLPAVNIPALFKNINEYAKKITNGGIAPERRIDIDAELIAEEINKDTFRGIAKMAPFGSGNPEPVFYTERMKITKADLIGDGKHLKMLLTSEDPSYDKNIQALAWRMGDRADELSVGVLVDVVYKISEEEWQGRLNLQMTIEDIRVSATR